MYVRGKGKFRMKRTAEKKNTKPKDPKDKGIFHRIDADGNITWWARIVRVDGNGTPRQYTRRANDKSHARRLKRELEAEHDTNGERGLDGARMLFRELAAQYKTTRLVPAVYHGEGEGQRKVGGLRSYKRPHGFLETLVEHFGAKLIRNITHDDLEQFKLLRLTTPKQRGGLRTIASVNRELELMRAAVRFAVRQGWLTRSPFEMGAPVISKADEARRERVLTQDEERRLLDACTGRRAHLRPLLIAALDTAMRRGELFKLRWRDVDLDDRKIKIIALNSKTARPRIVGMTTRLIAELEALHSNVPQDPNALVFGITDTVKKSFAAACKAAGVEGVRFHDCRHTAITRMVQANVAPMEIMKISGHTQHVTFARYVNPDTGAVQRAADALAAFNASVGVQSVTESVN